MLPDHGIRGVQVTGHEHDDEEDHQGNRKEDDHDEAGGLVEVVRLDEDPETDALEEDD